MQREFTRLGMTLTKPQKTRRWEVASRESAKHQTTKTKTPKVAATASPEVIPGTTKRGLNIESFSADAKRRKFMRKNASDFAGEVLSAQKLNKMLKSVAVAKAQKKTPTPLTPQQVEDAYHQKDIALPVKSAMSTIKIGKDTSKLRSAKMTNLKKILGFGQVDAKVSRAREPTADSASIPMQDVARDLASQLEMDSQHVNHVHSPPGGLDADMEQKEENHPSSGEGKSESPEDIEVPEDPGDPLNPGDSVTNGITSAMPALTTGMPPMTAGLQGFVSGADQGTDEEDKEDESKESDKECRRVDDNLDLPTNQQQNPENPYASEAAQAGVVMPTGTDASAFGFNQYRGTTQFEENMGFSEENGDLFGDVPTHSTNVDPNLRAEFGMAPTASVIPSTTTQLKSDIIFDMFDTVHEGFGNGDDNKLFLMEENRDAKIRYAPPMATPGASIGPEAGVQVSSWKLQREIPTEKMARHAQSMKRKHDKIMALYSKKTRNESTNILGDDVGFYRGISSKGLKRNRASILEPIIANQLEFTRVKIPTGAELNGFGFRLNTDAMRHPNHLNSLVNGMGGPTLGKRRSLEIILQ